MAEMARTSSRWVIVAEDVLEAGASSDVVASFQRHDRRAIYRSMGEWTALHAHCEVAFE